MVRSRKRSPLALVVVTVMLASCTPFAGGTGRSVPAASAVTGATPATRGVPASEPAPARAAPSVPPSGDGAPAPSEPAAPSTAPARAGSPAPEHGTLTRERAVALVLATDPRFAHARPLNPSLVGQSDWYEVRGTAPPYRVTVSLGWGDCPSGCISHHTWTFGVSASGTVTLLGEVGEPLE